MNSSVDLDPVQPWLPNSDLAPGTVGDSDWMTATFTA